MDDDDDFRRWRDRRDAWRDAATPDDWDEAPDHGLNGAVLCVVGLLLTIAILVWLRHAGIA